MLAFHNETIICNSGEIAPRFISFEGVILVHQCYLPSVVCTFLQGGFAKDRLSLTLTCQDLSDI